MTTLHSLPVAFSSASVSLIGGTGRGVRYAANPGVRNAGKVGALIDKINLVLTRVLGQNTGEGMPLIDLRWRGEPITNGFVPIGAVAWPQNRAFEAPGTFGSSSNNGNVYSIRLTKPFFLPAQDYIDVAFRDDLMFGNSTAPTIATVVAVGRQAVAPPAERWIPYLSSYIGPTYRTQSDTIADQSSPADLGNPFATPLFVERMIARVLTGAVAGSVYRALDDVDPSPTWRNYHMRVSDHRDNLWVAQPTPLPIVCNATDRSWILNHTMEPKGFLRVEFESPQVKFPDINVHVWSKAIVGLVGYRRIS